ncbi:MAG: glucoamylase family protein [Thermoanaerobaculia bacterium]
MKTGPLLDDELDRLQADSFQYFLDSTNARSGLVADSTREGSPSSIAAVGLGLSAYPVAVERGLLSRGDALRRVARTLGFLWEAEQGDSPHATGKQGFFYHFLDMESGRRVWDCEVSTIDSAYLFAGALVAAEYFSGADPAETRVRELAQALYARADWNWAQNGAGAVSLGWTPEAGFQACRWTGYNEALILYILGLGSPTHALPPESYGAFTATYLWRTVFGIDFLFAGPLFIHQLPHTWIDFRGIQDDFMRTKGIDYFENSRRATLVQQRYAIENPNGYREYGPLCWGITASEGPGPAELEIAGERRRFFGYLARGVPDGPDDGTIAPWAAVASLPFAPEIVLPTIRHFGEIGVGKRSRYGVESTFNPTFPDSGSRSGWLSPVNLGLNDGPIVLMIENYRSGLLWELTRRRVEFRRGLEAAGFRGGWLGSGTGNGV